MSRSADTVSQLRHDIDSGRTGDKVRGGDPAAAPLGTDEEAAGQAVPADAVRAARMQEAAHGDLREPAATRMRALRRRWTVTALAALAAILMLSIWLAP